MQLRSFKGNEPAHRDLGFDYYILVHKLDNKIKREWELQISSKELPTLHQL